jgi:mRNA-degrading endonuclease toxin of MazEF toxin-antitoxin module
MVCPIITKANGYPLHFPLNSNTKIKGEIKCEQIRALDLNAMQFEFVEYAPKVILNKVLSILMGTIKP